MNLICRRFAIYFGVCYEFVASDSRQSGGLQNLLDRYLLVSWLLGEWETRRPTKLLPVNHNKIIKSDKTKKSVLSTYTYSIV